MNDYDDGLTLTETEQAEYDAWQQQVAEEQWQHERETVWWSAQDTE